MSWDDLVEDVERLVIKACSPISLGHLRMASKALLAKIPDQRLSKPPIVKQIATF